MANVAWPILLLCSGLVIAIRFRSLLSDGCAGPLAPSHASGFGGRGRGALGKFDQRGVRQRFPGPLVLFRLCCLRSEPGNGDQRWVAACLELTVQL